MKLVDILARELKVWPEGVVTAVQDLDGEVKFDNSHEMPRMNNSKDVWIRQGDLYPTALAEDCSYAIVTLSLWQAAVDALNDIPKFQSDDVEWAGEGLPPVGTHVVVHDDGSLVYGHGESGEVLAHVEGCAVIRMSYGLGCFLPRCLRTPEQIAAEERAAAIEKMIMIDEKGSLSRTHFCGLLYDAGYRKFEIVDN